MELKSFDLGESHLEVEVQQKHLQPYGIVHGGVCTSLADAAIYWAVYAGKEESHGPRFTQDSRPVPIPAEIFGLNSILSISREIQTRMFI